MLASPSSQGRKISRPGEKGFSGPGYVPAPLQEGEEGALEVGLAANSQAKPKDSRKSCECRACELCGEKNERVDLVRILGVSVTTIANDTSLSTHRYLSIIASRAVADSGSNNFAGGKSSSFSGGAAGKSSSKKVSIQG